MFFKRMAIFIILLITTATASQTHASLVTFDFESLQGTGSNFGSFESYGNTIDIGDYRFSTGAAFGGFISYLPGFPLYSGAIALIPNQSTATTLLTRIDGNAFEINEISLAFSNLNQQGTSPLTFFGTQANNNIIQQTFNISNVTTSFTFSGFTDLVSLTWTHSTQDANNHRFNSFTVDNGVVSIPEPLPIYIIMLGMLILILQSARTKKI